MAGRVQIVYKVGYKLKRFLQVAGMQIAEAERGLER